MHPAHLLEWSRKPGIPDVLAAGVPLIREESLWYQAHLRAGNARVYGANTLTGHLDALRIKADGSACLQTAIVDSHCIGRAPYLPEETTRLCGYAKALSVSHGGTGMSDALYLHLLDSLADTRFQPLVPANASYSCGDVIPGAHWAKALLTREQFGSKQRLQPGEALALINGSFIDLGATCAFLPRLHECLVQLAINIRLVLSAFRHNVAAVDGSPTEGMLARDVIAFLARDLQTDSAAPIQLAVSLRAAPQVITTLLLAGTELVDALATGLGSRSCNPLISPAQGRVVSQASFMTLQLSLRKSALMDAVLLAVWATVRRITHVCAVLDDRLEGVSRLIPIQWPKLAQALQERARFESGFRPFSAGGSTSDGVEDLWSSGLLMSHKVATLLDILSEVLALEYLAIGLLQDLSSAPAARQPRAVPPEPCSRALRDDHREWGRELSEIIEPRLPA